MLIKVEFARAVAAVMSRNAPPQLPGESGRALKKIKEGTHVAINC